MLERFITAQAPVYPAVLDELRAGTKRTHWMWFIFPQLRGLGHSSTARFFGIDSLDEARAYLAHPVLGTRLIECVHVVLGHADRSLAAIFGGPDDRKFSSSMSLYALAAHARANVFIEALERFEGGVIDELTLANLRAKGEPIEVESRQPDRKTR